MNELLSTCNETEKQGIYIFNQTYILLHKKLTNSIATSSVEALKLRLTNIPLHFKTAQEQSYSTYK